MTETQEAPPADPHAQAEPQAAPAATPGPRLVHASLPNIVATLVHYSSVPIRHLEQAFHKHLEANPGSKPVLDVDHFAAVLEWCKANPEGAASVVLPAMYLANGRFVVQEAAPAEQPAAVPAAPAAPAEPADGADPKDTSPV